MNKNKLMVIMPLYNQEKFVKDAIESVLQQTHKNLELIIIDDCSEDGSLNIVRNYKNRENVTIIQTGSNQGCYRTRNVGLHYIKSMDYGYFTFHDPDDISDITRFETVLKYFNDENVLGIKPTYISVTEDLKPTHTFKGEGQAFFRRLVFDDILGYFDDTRFSGDTDYWWRLEAFCKDHKTYKVSYSTEPLYLRREHENNLTKKYGFDGPRQEYFRKIKSEIQTMQKMGNYYRNMEYLND